ncbi:protein LTO1 homolog isoform X1 [Ailuropoda melanoleuca]|uniref:protein LTO1 homolog isoform X1 n=1 Tax=Ailuropoda melanoleuca TaxID=9646 RepID=UPI001494E806|nr:protein LTO1 homolog isoform X1 [Ailuropoda melanoleuca]
MAGSQDMFDAIVMADERFHGEGYQEGYEEGNSLGIIEGRQYGTLHGAKIGSEMRKPRLREGKTHSRKVAEPRSNPWGFSSKHLVYCVPVSVCELSTRRPAASHLHHQCAWLSFSRPTNRDTGLTSGTADLKPWILGDLTSTPGPPGTAGPQVQALAFG